PARCNPPSEQWPVVRRLPQAVSPGRAWYGLGLRGLLPTDASISGAPGSSGGCQRSGTAKTRRPTPEHYGVQLCFPSPTSVGRDAAKPHQTKDYDENRASPRSTVLVVGPRNDEDIPCEYLAVIPWSSPAPFTRWRDER